MDGMAIRALSPQGAWRAYYTCLTRDEALGIETTNAERASLMSHLKAGRLVYWRCSDADKRAFAFARR